MFVWKLINLVYCTDDIEETENNTIINGFEHEQTNDHTFYIDLINFIKELVDPGINYEDNLDLIDEFIDEEANKKEYNKYLIDDDSKKYLIDSIDNFDEIYDSILQDNKTSDEIENEIIRNENEIKNVNKETHKLHSIEYIPYVEQIKADIEKLKKISKKRRKCKRGKHIRIIKKKTINTDKETKEKKQIKNKKQAKKTPIKNQKTSTRRSQRLKNRS